MTVKTQAALMVIERDDDRCVACGQYIHGSRGLDYSIHHRTPRGAGGSSRPESDSPANLLTVCGHGTAGCHGRIESNRAEAEQFGYLVRRGQDPAHIPVWVAYPPEASDGLDWDEWPRPGRRVYHDHDFGRSDEEPES